MMDALVQLSFAVQSILVAAAGRHDVTLAQVRLLGILRDREPGMMQLAQHLGLDKSSVTGLVDRAERRGLVRRTTSADDARVVHVSSTPQGRRLAKQVGAEIATEINTLTAPLNATERKQLPIIAARILAAQAR
jgi:MarR family transcriptional regulator, lower aerobic nicotinate degradation pathway regulator